MQEFSGVVATPKVHGSTSQKGILGTARFVESLAQRTRGRGECDKAGGSLSVRNPRMPTSTHVTVTGGTAPDGDDRGDENLDGGERHDSETRAGRKGGSGNPNNS